MKSRFLAALAACIGTVCLISASHAQGGAPAMSPQQRQQMAMQRQQALKAANEKMYKDIGVTPAQRPKFEALQTKYQQILMPKTMAVLKKAGANPSPATQKAAQSEILSIIMDVQVKYNKEFMAILTPAQQAKYKPYMNVTNERLAAAKKRMMDGKP